MESDPFSPLQPNPVSSNRPGRLSDVHIYSSSDRENVAPLQAQLKAFELGLRSKPPVAACPSREVRPPSFLERERLRTKSRVLSSAEQDELFLASIPPFTARPLNRKIYQPSESRPSSRLRPSSSCGTFGRASTGRLPPLSPRTPTKDKQPQSPVFYTPN